MKHHRRRKLLQELHSLYLDNLKDSQQLPWSKVQQLLGYYQVLKINLEISTAAERAEEMTAARRTAADQQLALFNFSSDQER